MNYSPFGKELEKIRIDNDMTPGEFAERLGMSIGKYRAVRAGRSEINEGVYGGLFNTFVTHPTERLRLRKIGLMSRNTVTLDMTQMTERDRAAALALYLRYTTDAGDSSLVSSSDDVPESAYMGDAADSPGTEAVTVNLAVMTDDDDDDDGVIAGVIADADADADTGNDAEAFEDNRVLAG